MPKMVDTYNRFKGKGLEFVAVAMNYDAPMYVVNYSQTRRLPFKVAMDDGSAAKQFGNIQLTPTTFLVAKDGTILKRYVGEPQFAELDQLLEGAERGLKQQSTKAPDIKRAGSGLSATGALLLGRTRWVLCDPGLHRSPSPFAASPYRLIFS
jgi:hypothetical protein